MSATVNLVLSLNDARLVYSTLIDRADDVLPFDPIKADDLLILAREVAAAIPFYVRPGNASPTTTVRQ